MKKLEYLTRMTSVRDDWSNEIPTEVKHSTDENIRYKVRKAWFGIAYLLIGLGKDKEFVDQQSYDMYKQFAQYTRDTNFQERLTIKKDIDKMDYVLTDIIEKLEAPE